MTGGCRPGEPFTVRTLVILSPYRADRSAAGQALVGQAADARLTPRLGTDLSKGYHRDLLYVGASRATDRLVVLEMR